MAKVYDVTFLREALDRADALAAAQHRTITALEGALAVYGLRIQELEEKVKAMGEAA